MERSAAQAGQRVVRGFRRALPLALLIASLALLFAPGFADHLRYAADPWRFNDDVRQQIWPLLRQADAALFRGDYIADYYLVFLPRGVRPLYALGGLVADARTVSKVLPYVELLVVVAALTAATWTLAGAGAAWGTGALCLSTGVYLDRMAGGLPRSFAFPLVALAVLALVRGAPRSLCALTVAAAAFYYPAAILLGATTAAYLLLIPAGARGAARSWSLRRRFAHLVATATAVALLGAPALLAGGAYGPRLGAADIAAYPEAGPGGRYGAVDLPLYGQFLDRVGESIAQPLLSTGPPWHAALRGRARKAARGSSLPFLFGAVVAAGGVSLLRARAGARRLLALVGTAVALYGLALALWPHLYVPSRYVAYSLGVVVPVLVPAAIVSLAQRWRRTRAAAGAIAVVVVAALVLMLGGRGPGSQGLMEPIAEASRPLYGVLARLPPDAVIAGWPGEAIENVPYLSRRSILIGYETHQAFHRGYLDEMRRRMTALIDAYFAADLAPLRRLRQEFGVTHLLVDREHYAGRPPSYFKPFDAIIARAARQAPAQPAPLRAEAGEPVYEAGPLLLLDLDRLPPAPEP